MTQITIQSTSCIIRSTFSRMISKYRRCLFIKWSWSVKPCRFKTKKLKIMKWIHLRAQRVIFFKFEYKQNWIFPWKHFLVTRKWRNYVHGDKLPLLFYFLFVVFIFVFFKFTRKSKFSRKTKFSNKFKFSRNQSFETDLALQNPTERGN